MCKIIPGCPFCNSQHYIAKLQTQITEMQDKGFWGRSCARLLKKNKELQEVVQAVKLRIHFIGLPSEPEDWGKEIKLIESVLMENKNESNV